MKCDEAAPQPFTVSSDLAECTPWKLKNHSCETKRPNAKRSLIWKSVKPFTILNSKLPSLQTAFK